MPTYRGRSSSVSVMKLFLAASTNPFDLKAALLAGHAQHPVIIHFPIALFIASVVFEVLAAWRKQPASRNGRLLQSAGCRADHPICDRYRSGSVAMAARRRSTKRQLTAAYDLRTDFRIAHLVSLLDAVASAREGRLAACLLFRSDVARADDDHPDRAPRWNPQRRGNALTSTERSSNEFQSEVRKSELDYCLFERSVKCVSSSVSFSTSAQAATQSPELTADAAQGQHLFVMNCRALPWRRCARRRRARFA